MLETLHVNLLDNYTACMYVVSLDGHNLGLDGPISTV